MRHGSRHGRREDFAIAGSLLKTLDEESIGALIGLGADIVILVDDHDRLAHVYFSNPELEAYGLSKAIGRRFQDCVTIESVPKIDRMLAKDGLAQPDRGFQINHPAPGKQDLPVIYSAYRIKGFAYTLVVGRELRQQMSDQQRLVGAQMELEADYRELQEAEARYRTAFKVTTTAQVMVDGERRTVLDANAAALALLSANGGNVTGKPLRDLFNRRDHDRLVEAVSEARHSTGPVNVDNMKSARGDLLSVTFRPYRENGLTNLILSLWPTTDERESRRQRVEKPKGATSVELDDLPVAAVQTDAEGIVLAANNFFLDLVHAPAMTQVLGRNIGVWFAKAAIDIQVLYARVMDEQSIRGFSSTLTDGLSDERPVTLSALFKPETRSVQLVVIPQSPGVERVTIPSPGIPDQAEGFSSLVGKVPLKDLIRESLDVIEKICIEAALDQTNNNRAYAAEILGLSRQGLYIKLRRHGLEDYRPQS